MPADAGGAAQLLGDRNWYLLFVADLGASIRFYEVALTKAEVRMRASSRS